jgi:hypothetical protein
LPNKYGLAAPQTGAAFAVNLIFAPGNVVRFEHLTIEDGLSQNAGLALFQDSHGYLCIGTQDGLNRYDGYRFNIFKHDPDDPKLLSYNSILSMEEGNGPVFGVDRVEYGNDNTSAPQHREDPSNLFSSTV